MAVPVLSQVEDFIQINIVVMRTCEDGAGVMNPRDGGGEHVERVADEADDARVGEEFGKALDLRAEGGGFCHVIFFACRVEMPL